jgi:hypothetical protein
MDAMIGDERGEAQRGARCVPGDAQAAINGLREAAMASSSSLLRAMERTHLTVVERLRLVEIAATTPHAGVRDEALRLLADARALGEMMAPQARVAP